MINFIVKTVALGNAFSLAKMVEMAVLALT
jgi:hypothetical protein